MRQIWLAIALLSAIGADAVAVTVPGPATFGRTFYLNDTELSGTEINTGQLVFSQPFVEQASYAPVGGSNVMTLTSQSSIAATGAPFVKAVVDGDYMGTYGVEGRSSATMSYQVVVTGGTPGTFTPVNFGTFGQLTNTSACSTCPNSSWLSASAQLIVRAAGVDYFLLGGSTDTLFQTGLGTTSILEFTTLSLPIDVPIDVILGVTSYGYTQEKWLTQTVGAIQSFAFLDPTFTPLEDGITILQSSNLILPSPAPEPATLALVGIGFAGLGLARRRKGK